jgi:hypothetical protein
MNTQFKRSLVLILGLILMAYFSQSHAGESLPGEFSFEVSLENRWYPKMGLYGNSQKGETSLLLKPEYSFSWDDDRKVLTLIPVLIASDPDTKKTRFDMSEANLVMAYDSIELRLGISKVFWGVTESSHLVDIINQQDQVANTDGEDKLGQPMVNLTWITNFGNLDFFVLPYFRERTFPGKYGRFRGPLVVDTDNPLFESEDQEKHIDFATRYSHSLGNLDLGLSFFQGTDRAPIFLPNSTGSALIPYYIQMSQVGIEAQYIYQSWLFKFEGISKQFELIDDHQAMALGFEYTFSNIAGSGVDIGFLSEYLYDSRKVGAIFDNHTFIGTRLALNDEKSTELLVGGIIEYENLKLQNLRLEGSRRINENWKWEVEASTVMETKTQDILHTFRDDDYLQFTLSYYF